MPELAIRFEGEGKIRVGGDRFYSRTRAAEFS